MLWSVSCNLNTSGRCGAFLSAHCLIASQVQSARDSFLMKRVTILSSGLDLVISPPTPPLLSGSRGEQEWKMSGGVNSTQVFPRVSPSFSADLGCRSISPDMQGEHKCTFRHWLLIAEMYAGQAHCSRSWPFWLSHREASRPTAAARSAALQMAAKLGLQSPPAFSYDKKKTPQGFRTQDGEIQHSVSAPSAPQSTKTLLDTANLCLNFLLIFLS